MIRLHGYYRSSTSYRLRIALELKGLDYEYVPVNLLESEQKGAAFTSRNPFGSVPLLEVDGKDYVQSMAQLEWLDEAYPDAPLLPGDAGDRYLARELAYAIATELHAPLNLPVLKYLAKEYGKSQDEIGICSCSSEAYNLAALALNLQQGDEVIISDLDFPAGATPWLQPSCPATTKVWRARDGALQGERNLAEWSTATLH